ncbi:MAG: hypothetical protein K9J30_11355 [Bacteroidales bacterium]|nr:hypothetical protein [Bacteroidales bacterium]
MNGINFHSNTSIYIISLLVSFSNLGAQIKSVGLPVVDNYTTEYTSAGSQTWDIIEDSIGNAYFGNNNGILKFDGEDWEIIPVSNGSIVRSLAQGSDGRIYVGGYTEIGYLDEDASGKMVYHNLNHLIPEKYRDFDDVWKIYQTRYGIIFQSFEYLFILNNETIRVIEPETRFGFSYYVNNRLYIIEKEIGLRTLNNRTLETISDNDLFTEDEIRFILPHQSNDLLIGSFSNGIFVLSKNKLTRWNTDINEIAVNNNIYNASRTREQYIFGTVKNGLYISTEDGTLVQHINRLRGLQNNTVLSHYQDVRGNLWLGLDNGIDYLKVSLPISFLNYNFNLEAVYTSVVHNGRLYVGTNQGLFTKPINELSDPTNIMFEMVKNTEGQVWSLYAEAGNLLCGHNRGAYKVNGTSATKISEARGVWNFFKLNGVDNILFSGTYDGIIMYEIDNSGTWKEKSRIPGIEISARKVVCDEFNNIWISHDYEGLFRIRLSKDLRKVESMNQYLGTSGLNGQLPYNIHLFEDEFFVSTNNGNMVYDSINDLFTPSEKINSFFSDLNKINFLCTDIRGNLWYVSENKIGFYRLLEDGTFTNIFTPLEIASNILIDNYEHIYTYDRDNVFIGSEKGLIHYNPSVTKDFFYNYNTIIKEVQISSKYNDSIWLYKGNKGMKEEFACQNYRVDYEWNTVKFTYTCPDPENINSILYSYRLLGYNEKWSDWSPVNYRDFSNLKDGMYTFEVRAKNIYNNISSSDSITFLIETPFYRTKAAYIIYLLLLATIVLITALMIKRRIEYIRSHEEEKHTAAFHVKEEKLKQQQMEAEREIERLKIDNLETTMKHKNKELANSTYHIIRKNKFLNSLKQELSELSEAAKSDFVEQELKKISRKIDRDINNEKSWEVFDQYFDEVHQEFLSRLKEKHPELSPKELRLSAYLRMNISTKEIAPLMNISIRGVEISRYRLRKKLDLDREINLTQYLMEI